MASAPAPKDFLSIRDLAGEMDALLAHAARLKSERRRGVLARTLAGRNLAMIFEKSSTRPGRPSRWR